MAKRLAYKKPAKQTNALKTRVLVEVQHPKQRRRLEQRILQLRGGSEAFRLVVPFSFKTRRGNRKVLWFTHVYPNRGVVF